MNHKLFYTVSSAAARAVLTTPHLIDTGAALATSNYVNTSTLTAYNPLYIKGTYSNGNVTIAEGIFTTTKPSSEDGYVCPV